MENNTPEKNPQSYFVTDLESQNFQEEGLGEKIRPVKDTAQKGLIKVWPSVIRGINTLVYYAIKIIKSTINIALSQLK